MVTELLYPEKKRIHFYTLMVLRLATEINAAFCKSPRFMEHCPLIPPGQDSSELRSTHSRMIRDVIGASPHLMKYDELRTLLKEHGQLVNPTDQKKEHDRLLAILQMKIVAAQRVLATEIKDLERTNVKETGSLPDSKEYKERLRKLKRCKALIRMWNITI